MSGKPQVSVIIPTYNRDEILPRAIESVLKQQYDNFEMLIVDDGSDDGTAEIANSYNDDRIKLFSHRVNKGTAAARNTGIGHASGEYIAFLDSDDEWLPHKLTNQISNLSGGSGGIIGAYSSISDKDRSVRRESTVSDFRENVDVKAGEELLGEILTFQTGLSPGSTLIVERDVVTEIGGFDETFDKKEDLELLVRLLQKGGLAFINDKSVLLGSSPRPDAEEIESYTDLMFEKHTNIIAHLENRGYPVRQTRRFQLAKLYFEEGDIKEGVEKLRNSRAPKFRQYNALISAIVSGMIGRLPYINPK